MQKWEKISIDTLSNLDSDPDVFISQFKRLFQHVISQKNEFDEAENEKKTAEVTEVETEITQQEYQIKSYEDILIQNDQLSQKITELIEQSTQLTDENFQLGVKKLSLLFHSKFPRVFEQLSTPKTLKKVEQYNRTKNTMQTLIQQEIQLIDKRDNIHGLVLEARHDLQPVKNKLKSLQQELQEKKEEKATNYLDTIPLDSKNEISAQINKTLIVYRETYATKVASEIRNLVKDESRLSNELIETLIAVAVDSTLLSVVAETSGYLNTELGTDFNIRQSTNLLHKVSDTTTLGDSKLSSQELGLKQENLKSLLPLLFEAGFGSQSYFERALLEELKQKLGPSKMGFSKISHYQFAETSNSLELIQSQENTELLLNYLYESFHASREPYGFVLVWNAMKQTTQEKMLDKFPNSDLLKQLHITSLLLSITGENVFIDSLFDTVSQQNKISVSLLENNKVVIHDEFLFSLLNLSNQTVFLNIYKQYFDSQSRFSFDINNTSLFLFVYLKLSVLKQNISIDPKSLIDCFQLTHENQLILTKKGADHPQAIELAKTLQYLNLETKKDKSEEIQIAGTDLSSEIPKTNRILVKYLSMISYFEPENMNVFLEKNQKNIRTIDDILYVSEEFVNNFNSAQEYNQDTVTKSFLWMSLVKNDFPILLENTAFETIINPENKNYRFLISVLGLESLFTNQEFLQNQNAFIELNLNNKNKVSITLKQKCFDSVSNLNTKTLEWLLESNVIQNSESVKVNIDKIRNRKNETTQKRIKQFEPFTKYLDHNQQQELLRWNKNENDEFISPGDSLKFKYPTITIKRNLYSYSSDIEILYKIWKNGEELIPPLKFEFDSSVSTNPFHVFRIRDAFQKIAIAGNIGANIPLSGINELVNNHVQSEMVGNETILSGDEQTFWKLLISHEYLIPILSQKKALKENNITLNFSIPDNYQDYQGHYWFSLEPNSFIFSQKEDLPPKLSQDKLFSRINTIDLYKKQYIDDQEVDAVLQLKNTLEDFLSLPLDIETENAKNYFIFLLRLTEYCVNNQNENLLKLLQYLKYSSTYYSIKEYIQITTDEQNRVTAVLDEKIYESNDYQSIKLFQALTYEPIQTEMLTLKTVSADSENQKKLSKLQHQNSRSEIFTSSSYLNSILQDTFDKTRSFDSLKAFSDTFIDTGSKLIATGKTIQFIKNSISTNTINLQDGLQLLHEFKQSNTLDLNLIEDLSPEELNFWNFALQTDKANALTSLFISEHAEIDLDKFSAIITPKIDTESGKTTFHVNSEKLFKLFEMNDFAAMALIENNGVTFDNNELIVYIVRNSHETNNTLLSYYDIKKEITPVVLHHTQANAEDILAFIDKISLNNEVNEDDLFRFFNTILNKEYNQKEIHSLLLAISAYPQMLNFNLQNILYENLNEISKLPDEKIIQYIDLSQRIDSTPSLDVQKIKHELIRQLIHEDDPLLLYQQIESIFLKNNLPLVGKILKIFEILYPDEKIQAKLIEKSSSNLSPVINRASKRKRRHIFYEDLIKNHIASNNRSLKSYLRIVNQGSLLSQRFENNEELNPDELKKLSNFISKVQTLHGSSTLGRQKPYAFESKEVTLSAINEIKTELQVKENQSIEQRVCEMFLKPIGVSNIEEAISRMEDIRYESSERNRKSAENNPVLTHFNEGDLIKGILKAETFDKGAGFTYLRNMLQNGLVAKDFLGAATDSDETPFDADFLQISQEDSQRSFEETFKLLYDDTLSGYGQLLVVIKDRGQFQKSDTIENPKHDKDHLELFTTGKVDKRHVGIRTGPDSSEIDYFIAHDDLINNKNNFESICFILAEQNKYCAIKNTKGETIFSYDEYLKLRKAYEGIEEFGGDVLTVSQLDSNHPLFEEIKGIESTLSQGSQEVQQTNSSIRAVIKETLGSYNINLKDEWDESLVGAEIHDVGSTGRNTNTPGDFDFDYTLVLDQSDQKVAKEIFDSLITTFEYDSLGRSDAVDGRFQLQLNGTKINDKKVDIDIVIVTKKEENVFATHDAIATKLSYIKEDHSEQAYNHAVANIILTKKILKEGHAYKKGDQNDGGFGGVGVENWILANNGNIQDAFTSFWEAAHFNGKRIPLPEFKQQYNLFDAGVNFRFINKHDNYIDVLTDKGYEAMLSVIEKYLT